MAFCRSKGAQIQTKGPSPGPVRAPNTRRPSRARSCSYSPAARAAMAACTTTHLGSLTWRIDKWASKASSAELLSPVFTAGGLCWCAAHAEDGLRCSLRHAPPRRGDLRRRLAAFPHGFGEGKDTHLSIALRCEEEDDEKFKPLHSCSFSMIVRAALGAADGWTAAGRFVGAPARAAATVKLTRGLRAVTGVEFTPNHNTWWCAMGSLLVPSAKGGSRCTLRCVAQPRSRISTLIFSPRAEAC